MNSNFKMMALFVATLGIASCSKTDLYDEGAKQAYEQAQEQAQQEAQQEKAADGYKDKFVETYGEIDPNQSWDFSTGDEYFNIPSGSKAGSRGEAVSYTMTKSEDYYEIQDATLEKMGEVFKEGEDNRALGKPFAMTVPGNKFTIMPIFMGQSGGDFDLYMHVDGVGEILVWRKWEDMQAKFNGSNTWKDLYETKNVNTGSWLFPKWETVRQSTTNGMNTVNATAIQSKYFTFEDLPEGATMYFYLKITSAASGYNTTGQSLGSVNNFMREYQFGPNDLKPQNLPGDVTNPEVKIIGCEDASNQNTTDNDFNDVVFMIYGEPYVPQSFVVEDLEKVVKKRYMIEDLGSKDDIDFNDIVVDVISTYSYKMTTSSSGIVTFSEEKLESRKAEIKALGGTLDFELNLGGKKWKKSDEFDATVMYNTDPIDYNLVLAELELPLTFDPATNNISVTVYQKDSDKVSAEVNFPASGTTPMIIAFNSYVQWSKERVRFPFEDYVNK